MNELKIFENENLGTVRTITTDSETWFIAGDVCRILGLTNTTMVMQRLDEDERSKFNLGRQGETNVVNEPGLYELIMGSRKPEAKAFRKWITSEVLPAIRKDGGYIAANGMSDEEVMAKALEIAHKTIERKALENKELKKENVRLESENVQLAIENQELRHDKNYLDLIMRSKALLTISQIAQDYGMSGKAMNKQLAAMGIQYSCNGQWILYARYKDCGYVSSRSIDITRADGRPDVVLHTEWTQAGRKFLYEELKKQGIIPMLERD
jgi:prophage antirepressor-like protein